MLTFIDRFLNRITMYRLVLYYLIALVAIALVFGAFGILPYNPLTLLFSIGVLLVLCWIINKLFADAFKAHANVESVYITALILALIITPVSPASFSGIMFLVWAAVWAMASKFIFAIGKKHVFNPAAIAVVITAFAMGQYASWWVGGNLPMMAFVVIGGLLVTRKIQRFDLVIAFFAAAIVSIVLTSGTGDWIGILEKAFTHAPLFFFAFVMLTEPLTTPPTRELRIAYGALVGFLFAPMVHIGSVYSTPELALVAGNVFSYCVSPKGKHLFVLKEKNAVGSDIIDFVFKIDRPLKFKPGQYMEWTLNQKKADSRGNRRYFTIASSSTERDLHLGVKFYEPSSSFKKQLLALAPGDSIAAGQLAGDFVLPDDKKKKLAFIAGGIGVTPFRSMAKYLADKGEARSVVMLYANRNLDDIAYREVFNEAQRKIGMKTVYLITGADQTPPVGDGIKGRLDAALLKREIPDYADRIFYVSGTHAMVAAAHKIFRELGIPQSQIKTDFFPGFA
jgi:ferredoxin-NADP reductase/Na+-translocating ferredoxin:NAD+ oxidoreductase RnfD subunit